MNLRQAQSEEETFTRARNFLMQRLADNHDERVELERQLNDIEARHLAAKRARERAEMPAILKAVG